MSSSGDDEELRPQKGPGRSSRSPRRHSAGRRRTDLDPRVTFTRKFLVIAVAVVNAVYLVSDAFLSAIHGC
jgi:hypothetical protein